MVDRKLLSKSEMEVARVLWETGPSSVREIHEILAKRKDVDVTTVQTFLRRIESKGYAKSKLDGRARIYESKTRPKTVIREAVEDFVDRLFGGDSLPLLRHLVEQRSDDSERLAELRNLVDELEQKGSATPKERSSREHRKDG